MEYILSFFSQPRSYKMEAQHQPRMDSGAGEMGSTFTTETNMLQGKTVAVPIEDAVYDVLNQSKCLSEIIRMKFDCEAFLMDSARTTQSGPGPVPDKKVYEKTIGKRVNLSVWMGDLTQQRVAAVVNAANEDLIHCGGLALAIVTTGGPEIERASKAITNKRGRIPTGDCVFTTGGNLPCKYVIHAVGPDCTKLGHSHGQCKELLKKAIRNIFEGIAKEKVVIDSVAIPALSSGIFNFPLLECAEIIVRSIKELSDRDRLGQDLKEIRLVNNDEKTVNAMKKACEDIFGRNESGSFLGSSPKSISSQSSDTIRINNVILQITKGRIEDQETTVIVNSVDQNRKLSDGNISKAILSKAGNEIQDEIKKKPLSAVMKTRGYKLPCSWVYHLIIADAHMHGRERFRQVVSECLEKTAKENIKSISFPAIGTGNLQFSKKEVANIMISEVIRFAKQHSARELQVYFVIYPQDAGTFKAFIDELQSQRPKQNASQDSAPADSAMASSDSGTFEPKSSISTVLLDGSNFTNVQEAEAWIQNTLKEHQHGLMIENNHIIQFGAQEHKELVNKLDPSIFLLETVEHGSAHISITGIRPAVIKAALEIEKLLCEVQQQHELVQMGQLEQLADLLDKEYGQKRTSIPLPKASDIKKTIESYQQQYKDKEKEFEKAGLLLFKMEQIQNPLLKTIYQSKKDYIELKRKKSVISTLYHQVPAQFCLPVCRIGFQRLYSHPHEPRYGAGMYFSKSLRALQVINKQMSIPDQYVYIFQAEVITGSFTRGKESYILPPPVGEDYMDLHDSVVDSTASPETFVIFNSSQAIPQFLFTCKRIR